MAGPERLEGIQQHPHSHGISPSEKSPSAPKAANSTHGKNLDSDSVEISRENAEFQQLLKRIEQVPDIRPDRLEKIQQALKNGTYHINSDVVAHRIIQEVVNDEKASPRISEPPPSS